ncbi:MAG: citramalate synthase [Myxococcales bacterium]|nr:citramalate synthase [Myxococcales bacterium]
MANPPIQLYDTTLRDGTQREGISYSCQDKIRIAQRLDLFGVHFIEGGWPGSNPKDIEFFDRAKDMAWTHAAVAAFGSTRRVNVSVEDDANLNTLLAASTPVCTVFGKSWGLHVTDVLRTTLDENLRLIEESVAYLVVHGRRVIYDAEHYFDGYCHDSVYALETINAAKRGGAEVCVLCDTNGGNLPWRIEEVTRNTMVAVEHPLGIHAHNDTGCAVANSLAAVQGGAIHIQGTVNGYGERCGNANLMTIVPNLELKMDRECLPKGRLNELQDVSRYVTQLANLPFDEHAPYVGRSAFAHKGGVHVAAMRRNALSYQHIEPEWVGNEARTLVSELSGRGNVLTKAEEHGVHVASGVDLEVLQHIKLCEAQGYSFESAEASVALMLERRDPEYLPPFRVIDYEVKAGMREGSRPYAEATVKVDVHGQTEHAISEGDGPVAALDAALRKALGPYIAHLDDIQLVDYKVRILDGGDGTSAIVRVLIDCRRGLRTWGTVGASGNIIEASLYALVDGIEYGLLLDSEPARTKPTHLKASTL